MNITIAQLNPTVGDIQGNVDRLEQAMDMSGSNRPGLTIFPELYLTGYPPRDLLEREAFIREAEAALAELADYSRRCPGLGILVGTVTRAHEPPRDLLERPAFIDEAEKGLE